MSKRNRLLIALTLALALLAAGYLWLRPRGPSLPFVRLDVASTLHDPKALAIDPCSGEIRWRGQRKKRRSRVSGIGGAGFRTAGQKSFPFSFPWRGRCGFFCYYDLRPSDGPPLAMELWRRRRDAAEIVARVERPEEPGYFVHKLDVRRSDRFELRWSGKGRVFIGQPLLYRVVPAAERETVVMLAADTLRADQIDARANGVAVAPFLSRFAGECARFDRCLSPSTWTLPSFTSLFTSRHEIIHGMNAPGIIGAEHPFLVEALRGRFITVNFNGGLWLQFQGGFHRGFDIVREGGYFGERKTVMAESLLQGTLALLERAEFPAVFLFLHTYQVHTPYRPPADLLRRLDPGHPVLAGGAFPEGPPAAGSSAEEKEQYYRLYQAGVSVLDREVERFFAGLKRTGLYPETMFMLFGDHGEAFGEHGDWEHGTSLFEEQIRVPLLLRFPGGRFAGFRADFPVSMMDLFPTVLDWVGLPPAAAKIDGVSLMPALRSGQRRPEPVVSSLMNCWYDDKVPPQLALSFSRYKLIVTFAGAPGGREQARAYDLASDPGEKAPLAVVPPEAWKQALPLIRMHRSFLARPRRATGKKKGADLDPELREQMKALGYL
ncbi:MAG: sulfatase [Candidatus Aminicenantes bacterium]|nr:sulfatase [Candidatus Aminicenantes bacterium]